MARPPTLWFDRGTLLLHPPPPGKAWIDYATWDDRVERFRHPLAAGVAMTRLVMAVVVAERAGLHAAATRFACADGLSARVSAARDAALSVEAATLDACVPEATYGEVVQTLARAYAEVGHGGAWEEHYQGGPVGYRQREFEIVPSQRESRWYTQRIEPGHAVAWNPSVAGGGKSEDTFLIDDDGLHCLTDTGEWPQAAVADGLPRTAILDIATGVAA